MKTLMISTYQTFRIGVVESWNQFFLFELQRQEWTICWKEENSSPYCVGLKDVKLFPTADFTLLQYHITEIAWNI